jgi:hypothetical protein
MFWSASASSESGCISDPDISALAYLIDRLTNGECVFIERL